MPPMTQKVGKGGTGSRSIRAFLLATAALLECAPGEAHAQLLSEQSLSDFLRQTVADNPTIGAARAAARAAQASIAIARADGLPSLALSGSAASLRGDERTLNGALPATVDTQVAGNAAFDLPLYRGGAVRHGTAAARARYRAAQADYDRVLGDTLTAAAQAYAATARDEVLVDLHRADVDMLVAEQAEVSAGARHGEASKTDIRQAEARLAGARADLARAEAQRTTSIEELARLTGKYPDRPIDIAGLRPPDRADGVADTAAETAPAVRAQEQRVLAARYDVAVARAAGRPQLSFTASGTYVRFGGTDPLLRQLGSLDQYAGWRTTVGLDLRIPLFQGGLVGARVRRAQAVQAQNMEQRTAVARDALAQLRVERAELGKARAQIPDLAEAVERNREAVRGVRIDRRLGFRSGLDVLNAERELLDSRKQLASARAEAFSRAVALLNAAGRATDLLAAPVDPVPSSQRHTGPAATDANAHRPILLASTFDLGRLASSRVTRAFSPQAKLSVDPAVLRLADPRRLGYDPSLSAST